MSSYSLYDGRIAFDSAQVNDEDPIDTEVWRILANNAIHYADEDCQTRVAWSDGTVSYVFVGGPAIPTSWRRMVVYGPWDHRLRPDGKPYPMRFRIAGSTSIATNQIRLALVVSSVATSDVVDLGTAGNAARVSTSSTTAAWLSTDVGPETLLTFSQSMATDAAETRTTIDGVAGDPAGVETCEMVATVWGQYTGTQADAYLNGLYLQELPEGTDAGGISE